MIKTKRKGKVTEGTRIRVIRDDLTWSGMHIPRGTVGTVFVSTSRPLQSSGYLTRNIRFDGFPEVQPSGYYFGIGGSANQTYMPNWAELAE